MKKTVKLLVGISVLVLLLGGAIYADESEQNLVDSLTEHFNSRYGYGNFLVRIVESLDDIIFESRNEDQNIIYVLNSWQPLRATCYMCGSPNMTLGSGVSESSILPHACPTSPMGWDLFKTYDHYSFERCTACGYVSDSWVSYNTYKAQCNTGNSLPNGQDWEVKYEYTQSNGYDLHQSLRYWLYESYE